MPAFVLLSLLTVAAHANSAGKTWSARNTFEISASETAIDNEAAKPAVCPHKTKTQIAKLKIGAHEFGLSCSNTPSAFYLGDELAAEAGPQNGARSESRSVLYYNGTVRAVYLAKFTYTARLEANGKIHCGKTITLKKWDAAKKAFFKSPLKGNLPAQKLKPSAAYIRDCGPEDSVSK